MNDIIQGTRNFEEGTPSGHENRMDMCQVCNNRRKRVEANSCKSCSVQHVKQRNELRARVKQMADVYRQHGREHVRAVPASDLTPEEFVYEVLEVLGIGGIND